MNVYQSLNSQKYFDMIWMKNLLLEFLADIKEIAKMICLLMLDKTSIFLNSVTLKIIW